MANAEVFGFEDLNRMFRALENVPFRVVSGALNQMALVGESAVMENGAAMGVFDPTSRKHILTTVNHTKPKQNRDGGGYCIIVFKGARRRGNTVTNNALIAFENEYGNRHQTARPFIRLTAAQDGERIAAPGVKALEDWMENTFKNG